jgi:signal transduction histidine kinase
VSRARLAYPLTAGAVIALAAFTIARSAGDAGTAHAGTTWTATVSTLLAALALFVASALVARRGTALTVFAAGVCWLAPIPAGWLNGPPLVRSLALIAAALTFPLLAHLALAAPEEHLAGRVERAVIAAGYAWAVFAALVLAAVRDPFYDLHCWIDCDGNALLVMDWTGLSGALVQARPWLEIALGAAVAGVASRKLGSASLVARASTLAGVAVGAVSAVHGFALLSTPLEDPADPTFRRVYFAACGAVVLVALALGAPYAAARLRRRAVRRMVATLDAAPAPDELERKLGAALGDPMLRIVFRLPELERYVDTSGVERAAPVAHGGRAVTPLLRRGEPVAWLDHDATGMGAVDTALTSALRLSVDNARLRAGLLAQVRDLRHARQLVVQEGDDERRRVERDLHDGVQQQLLALGSDLRTAARIAREVDTRDACALEDAVRSTATVLEEVRSVAHGIYPAILTDAGLAEAVASFADVATLPVEVRRLPKGRYPPPVETAAYRVVVEAVENAASYSGAPSVDVEIDELDGMLHVRVHDDGRGGAHQERHGGLVELADRVGAIDGTISVESVRGGGTTIAAVIPCAS